MRPNSGEFVDFDNWVHNGPVANQSRPVPKPTFLPSYPNSIPIPRVNGTPQHRISTIYIGSLPQQMSRVDILRAFSQFGNIAGSSWRPGRRFAFLKYENHQQASSSIFKMNNNVFLGKKIIVGYAKKEFDPNLSRTFKRSEQEKEPIRITQLQEDGAKSAALQNSVFCADKTPITAFKVMDWLNGRDVKIVSVRRWGCFGCILQCKDLVSFKKANLGPTMHEEDFLKVQPMVDRKGTYSRIVRLNFKGIPFEFGSRENVFEVARLFGEVLYVSLEEGELCQADSLGAIVEVKDLRRVDKIVSVNLDGYGSCRIWALEQQLDVPMGPFIDDITIRAHNESLERRVDDVGFAPEGSGANSGDIVPIQNIGSGSGVAFTRDGESVSRGDPEVLPVAMPEVEVRPVVEEVIEALDGSNFVGGSCPLDFNRGCSLPSVATLDRVVGKAVFETSNEGLFKDFSPSQDLLNYHSIDRIKLLLSNPLNDNLITPNEKDKSCGLSYSEALKKKVLIDLPPLDEGSVSFIPTPCLSKLSPSHTNFKRNNGKSICNKELVDSEKLNPIDKHVCINKDCRALCNITRKNVLKDKEAREASQFGGRRKGSQKDVASVSNSKAKRSGAKEGVFDSSSLFETVSNESSDEGGGKD